MRLKTKEKEWAASLLRDTLVWDAHGGIFPAPDADLSRVTDWKENGVDYVSLNIGFDVMPWQDCVSTLSSYRRMLDGMDDRITVVSTVGDIEQARANGKFALSFDIEGANALNGDIGMLSVYHDLGVRQMLLAYNLNNQAAGGCHDQDIGLTAFGRDVVKELNRLGMIIDCSHTSRQTSLEMMECSEQPVVFTHSNPMALRLHQRNIDDDQIRGCAATGGVIGVNGMGIFLGENDTSVDTFANHVCYIADLTGPEHVGFGLDWKPPQKSTPDLGTILRSRPDYWPAGQAYDTPGIKLFGPDSLIPLVVVLHHRGWTDAYLNGFLGGNFRRVAERVWRN